MFIYSSFHLINTVAHTCANRHGVCVCFSLLSKFIIRRQILWRQPLKKASPSEASLWLNQAFPLKILATHSQIISIAWYEIQEKFPSASLRFTCVSSELSGLDGIIAFRPACVCIYYWCLCGPTTRRPMLDVHYHIYGLMVRDYSGMLSESSPVLPLHLKWLKSHLFPPHLIFPVIGRRSRKSWTCVNENGVRRFAWWSGLSANKAACVFEVKGGGTRRKKY